MNRFPVAKMTKSLLTLCFSFTFLNFSQSVFRDLSTQFLETRFKKYVENYKFPDRFPFCSYVNVNQNSTRDIANFFIKHGTCPSIITSTFISTAYAPKSQATFVFVESVEKINETVDDLRQLSIWDSRRENHFIICRRMGDAKFLPKFLKAIWTRHILNFVVVFVSDRLEIFSYNPFNNRVVNVSELRDHYRHLFPNKLTNLYGYELKVSLFDNFPLTTKENGQWVGEDYNRLLIITSMINATFRIIEPSEQDYTGSYEDAMSGVTDFCFISHYYMPYLYQGAHYTYPHEQNEIVLVVPKQNKSSLTYKSLLTIFYPSVWIIFFIFMIILSLIFNLSKNQPIQTTFFKNLSASLGYSFPGFSTQPFVIKIQLLSFIVGCIIIRTAFQCFLVSSFVHPKPQHQINTISEFRQSDMKICTSVYLANMIPPEYGLSSKVVNITSEERIRGLYSLNTSAAYGIIWTVANKFIETLKSKYENPPFYIMKEILVPSLDTYIFQRHSPYLEKFSECLMVEKEFALSTIRVHEGSSVKGNVTRSDINVVLSMKHLHSVFSILFVGLLSGVMAFVAEILYKNKSKCVRFFSRKLRI